jgi:DNA-binding NarL/FixJ family response regulator
MVPNLIERNETESRSSGINVFLIAENRLLRETLGRVLQKRAGIGVVGISRATASIREEIVASHSEIVLTDCLTSGRDAGVVSELFEHIPQIKVILFGMDEDPDLFLKCACLGVSGYLLQDASTAEIISAVRGVARGEAACPPKLCMTLIQHLSREYRQKPKVSNQRDQARCLLTYRQLELLGLVARGLSNKEIAANLHLSEFTVKNHVRRIMKQVDADDRFEAVDMIRASGFLPSA